MWDRADDMDADKYRVAGRILSKVLREAAPKIQVGVALLEVAEEVERSIRDAGASPAFPCNISRGREAAHYTPAPADALLFGEDMVKLDVGVHLDGYIADAAVTVDLSGHPELVEASQAALEAAIELVAPGVSTSVLGSAIEDAIEGYGFRPVSNLTGHGLARFRPHAEPSIPNRGTEVGIILQAGDVIAIEPFATDGIGRISESPVTEIYGLACRRPVRAAEARALLKEIEGYLGMPFARRWLSGQRTDYALLQLLRAGVVHRFPVLWEAEGALVSQAEHTVMVTEDGKEVTTR
ncbi:MAG: Methionine aminopeptidase [Methanosaeta sp. PtaB.Bin039]|nr:MAG: Methionine aminopeptidase [Methanosaeta sp. PtaB.Bin039]HOT06132.1 type II methionyl aminopeptidase [Methanotrichaceae archaeon]HQF15559.1 type II methionyl aminopeptidase [Methanotrichaceae archaeon]HQI90295.1 type II methionyl aminopeptidase [Methanotrichaceae archaeon]HQJ27738.1 type II methionyl aminopeptidase [Methanotrichaceae archaeon]